MATAGQKGLKINAPDARLQLRHLPNSKPDTHLQAAWLLFVGVKLLLPGQDVGIDVARGNDGSALSLEIMQYLHSNRDVACPAALFSSQQTAVEQLCESGTVGQRQG